MGVYCGIKTKFVPLDLYFGMLAQPDYQLLKLGSLRHFLISFGYQAAIK